MRLVENTKITIKDAIDATGGLQTAANGVNMRNYAKCRIILNVACSNAAVVGGAVTLKQGTTATCSTALAYSEYWKNEDVLAGDTLTKVTAATCSAGIQNKTAQYIFEVRADMLDSDTFKSENQYIRLDLADITTATEVSNLIYELYEPRYARGAENMPTAY